MAQAAYIVSALKHRPSRFSEVLAQDHITQTLRNSLKRGRIANAYLFSGPRGTGKTTTARILAKALNCENPQDGEPCNQCDSCRMIAQGNHPDVLEIDAASNTGVDNIRELRENARFTPSIGRYKIYIIDECHMLSTQANNALLKTLEEPPAHCRFIFATTELHKILPTILSRCQRYPFRLIPANIIADHLRKILQQQADIQIADPAELNRILYLLARMAEGCLRDALFALDQLIAFCSGQLQLSEVEEIMGAIEFDQLDRYVRALVQEDLASLFQIIQALTNQGKEISLFLSECLQYLRNLAVLKIAPQNQELVDLPDEYRQRMAETAALTSLEQILYITDQLWDTEERIRNSSMGRLILEMASIKAAKAGQAVRIEDLLRKISSGGLASSIPAMTFASPQVVPRVPAPVSPAAPRIQTPVSEEPVPLEAYEDAPPESPEPELIPSPPPPTVDTGSLGTLWSHFLHELEEKYPLLAGALENSAPVDITNGRFRIAIPAGNPVILQTLERPQNRNMLTTLIHQSFGQKLALFFEPYERLNQPDIPPVSAQPVLHALSKQQLMEKVQQNQIFSKLMEELPGRVVDIKPEGQAH